MLAVNLNPIGVYADKSSRRWDNTSNRDIIVKISSDDKIVIVQVKDYGIGVPESEKKKIFKRFYQVDSSFTRKVGGTGIGLNIAKVYVEMHGGEIWVESKLDKGSTFSFTLPIRAESEGNEKE